MDENNFEGTAREFGGRVQDAVGGLTGDTSTQAEGKINQAYGKAQQTFGSAADEIRDNVVNQPLTALLLAVGVGAVLGFFARR